jgi:hypothetical protein
MMASTVCRPALRRRRFDSDHTSDRTNWAGCQSCPASCAPASEIARSSTRSAWRRPAWCRPSAVLAIATTTRSPRRSTGRTDPSARAVALTRSRRVRHARTGRLVQQPSLTGADRQRPASRSRSGLLRSLGKTYQTSRLTQTKQPPRKSASDTKATFVTAFSSRAGRRQNVSRVSRSARTRMQHRMRRHEDFPQRAIGCFLLLVRTCRSS